MTLTFATLPLSRTWLDDIVDEIHRSPHGTSHVSTLVNRLIAVRDVGAEPEATITRTINNYCGDARDVEHVAKVNLFERVDSGTYKLISYPMKPSLIDIQQIKFADPAYQYVWDRFSSIIKDQHKVLWEKASNTRKLEIFVKNVREGGVLHALFDNYAEFSKSFSSRPVGPDAAPDDLGL